MYWLRCWFQRGLFSKDPSRFTVTSLQKNTINSYIQCQARHRDMRHILNLCATTPLRHFLATIFAPSHQPHCGTAPLRHSATFSVQKFASSKIAQLSRRFQKNLTHNYFTKCNHCTVPVTCLLSQVSCYMSPFSCIMSPGARLLSHVSYLTSPVSCLLSHISCLISPVLSPVSRLLSHVSYLTSSLSCLISPVFCLLSSVSYLLSHISYLTSSVSRLLCHVSCLTSPVLHPAK